MGAMWGHAGQCVDVHEEWGKNTISSAHAALEGRVNEKVTLASSCARLVPWPLVESLCAAVPSVDVALNAASQLPHSFSLGTPRPLP